MRIGGNINWVTDFTETVNTTTQGGGKPDSGTICELPFSHGHILNLYQTATSGQPVCHIACHLLAWPAEKPTTLKTRSDPS
jgi:hypothetical protein